MLNDNQLLDLKEKAEKALTSKDPFTASLAFVDACTPSTISTLVDEIVELRNRTVQHPFPAIVRQIRQALDNEAEMFKPGRMHHNGPRRISVDISLNAAQALVELLSPPAALQAGGKE